MKLVRRTVISEAETLTAEIGSIEPGAILLAAFHQWVDIPVRATFVHKKPYRGIITIRGEATPDAIAALLAPYPPELNEARTGRRWHGWHKAGPQVLTELLSEAALGDDGIGDSTIYVDDHTSRPAHSRPGAAAHHTITFESRFVGPAEKRKRNPADIYSMEDYHRARQDKTAMYVIKRADVALALLVELQAMGYPPEEPPEGFGGKALVQYVESLRAMSMFVTTPLAEALLASVSMPPPPGTGALPLDAPRDEVLTPLGASERERHRILRQALTIADNLELHGKRILASRVPAGKAPSREATQALERAYDRAGVDTLAGRQRGYW